MANGAKQTEAPNTTGLVLHRAFGYDLLVVLLSLGGERIYREKTLELAGLKAGESVLDVGCGTGTFAIAAKRHVESTGKVYGIDASPEMIARARKKAKKAAADVAFENAFVENLPFSDATFDVVLSTTAPPFAGQSAAPVPPRGWAGFSSPLAVFSLWTSEGP